MPGDWIQYTPDKPLTEAGLRVYRTIVPSLMDLGDGRYVLLRSDYERICSWFKPGEAHDGTSTEATGAGGADPR